MLTKTPELTEALDRDMIGFLTAVDSNGQPQTSPVWFLREGEDLIVFNRPTSRRLESIRANPKVAFNLRADRRASATVSLEGLATVEDLPDAQDIPAYVEKYGREIERLKWTPASFSADYSVGLRIVITRVRAWGLEALPG
jgi:PPOX class probable F420-dependent enzyme